MLNQGRYRLNGNIFAMPKHGFARNSLFELVDCDDEGITLSINDSDATRANYPFAFRLDINFEIAGSA